MTCVYCNVLTSKITAEATCDRLSCYPTRTFRAWAYLAGFEEYNSRTDPFGKRSTSLYARWTFMARYLPKLCHQRAMSCLSSPVSAVYAWNAWDHDSPFGEENGCILWLGLSYGSPSNYSMSPRWIISDKITNERVARVGYNPFISNKGK